MKSVKRKRRGRPKRIDSPKLFSTTLPESIYELLAKLSKAQGKTKSAILTDAITLYARHAVIKPM